MARPKASGKRKRNQAFIIHDDDDDDARPAKKAHIAPAVHTSLRSGRGGRAAARIEYANVAVVRSAVTSHVQPVDQPPIPPIPPKSKPKRVHKKRVVR